MEKLLFFPSINFNCVIVCCQMSIQIKLLKNPWGIERICNAFRMGHNLFGISANNNVSIECVYQLVKIHFQITIAE